MNYTIAYTLINRDAAKDCSFELLVEAVAYLVKTGDIWFMSDEYQRYAKHYIFSGILDYSGHVYRQKLSEYENAI